MLFTDLKASQGQLLVKYVLEETDGSFFEFNLTVVFVLFLFLNFISMILVSGEKAKLQKLEAVILVFRSSFEKRDNNLKKLIVEF